MDAFSRFADRALNLPIYCYLALVLPIFYYTAREVRRRYLTSLWISTVGRWRLFFRANLYNMAFVLSLTAVHLVVAVAIWQCEYNSDTLKPATPLATKGLPGAMRWLQDFITLGESRYELRSEYSTAWIALLKGSYWFSGLMVAGILTRSLVRTGRYMKPKNHVAVLGWHDQAQHLTRDLRDQKSEFLVATLVDHAVDLNMAQRQQAALVSRAENVSDALDHLDFQHARSLIVLADEAAAQKVGAEHVDLWVLRTLRQIAEYEERHELNRSVKVIVELRDPDDVPLAEAIRADEAICEQELGIGLIAQASNKPTGMAAILRELLHTGHNNNEVYFYQLTPAEIDRARSFDGLAKLCQAEAHPAGPIVVLGIRSQEGLPEVNPRNRMLKAGDEVIVWPVTSQIDSLGFLLKLF